MRFSVFTHVDHLKSENSFFAYAPYVREMNLWFEKVDEVEIVAPLTQINKGEYPSGEEYQLSHFVFTKIPSINFLNFQSFLSSLLNLPVIFYRIFKAMQRADHIHLRCPGNIGLIACFIQIFYPEKSKTTKYAGNWDPEAKQPLSYKIQKFILNNSFLTRNMTVLIYGNWDSQSRNITSFFTASFKESEKEEVNKKFEPPYSFLYVGNLVPGKNPLFAVNLVEALNKNNIDAKLHVYGDGELMDSLKTAAGDSIHIHFYGNQPLERLKQAYKEAHFLTLASQSEGWPKAVAESMFFGCVPVATPVSCVPWMLDYGHRGILVSDLSEIDNEKVVAITVEKIKELIHNPEEMRKLSDAALEWSQQYTIERFKEAIKEILESDKRTKRINSSLQGRGGELK